MLLIIYNGSVLKIGQNSTSDFYYVAFMIENLSKKLILASYWSFQFVLNEPFILVEARQISDFPQNSLILFASKAY